MTKGSKKKKVHLIGICGAGMAALAVLCKEKGYEVSGSDVGVFEPMPSYLKRNRVKFFIGHRPENVPVDASIVVVGNHAGLAPEENPETRRAVKLGLPVKSLPEMLAILSEDSENIVVAGSYGKSTMTALVSFCLVRARRDPSYFIGAVPIDLKNSSHAGTGGEFVLEGDEYTSAYWDQRSKFLHLRPSSVILIAALHDHVNKFPTERSYVAPFKKLAAKIPKNGMLVYGKRGANNEKVARAASARTVSYAFDDRKADWYAANVRFGKITEFDIIRRGKKVIRVRTKLLGKHNIENIVGAAAFLLERKKMPLEAFARAVRRFGGIKRRIELRNPGSETPVYEGFGSSYEKARAVFDALRLHFPKKRIVAVFEPHAFSWRNEKFIRWYRDIWSGVDEVIMLPAVSRGKAAPGQLSTADIWNEARRHFPVRTARTEKEALDMLKRMVKKGDVVALVSSGPMLGLTESVPKLF